LQRKSLRQTTINQVVKAHPADAERMLVAELKAETKTDVPADTVAHSLQRIELTTEVSRPCPKGGQDGQDTGFIKAQANTRGLIENLLRDTADTPDLGHCQCISEHIPWHPRVVLS
jgi:hypothetical protein